MIDAQAIIFDMDGVITDTEALHARVESEVCEAHELPAPKELWSLFKGRTTQEIFSILIDQAGRTDLDPAVLAAEKVERYMLAAPGNVRLIPGVDTFIRQAKERGYTLALTTSSVREVADLTLKEFGLTEFFPIITTGDEVTKGKPDPEAYRMTVARLGLDAASCAVIEDSDNGIRAASAAGCTTIGITTSFPETILREAGAMHVVHSFDALSLMLPPRQ